MSCPFTSEVLHNLCLLHKRQTGGYRLLVAVGRKNNNLVVFCDTDSLTGILLRVVLIRFGKYNFAVIYKHFVDTECFLYIALIGFVFISVADFYGTILKNCKIC